MKTNKMILPVILLTALLSLNSNCSKNNGGGGGGNPPPAPTSGITTWLTKGDQSALLQKQAGFVAFANGTNNNPTIEVDSSVTYQTVDGFGYTLTGGSAYLINRLS